ncbi:flagellar biosynthesis anti-sigma factor FlgM [Vibrio panuliri]|uniref:Negative regulator of flagellin synthesis n=1 Tax=Vibrio panuliri TaxID=1381081 RepID=A0A1Q9HMJ4_9VIBR|nr:flagellar biosynthesis anti-sigma factor FlgM [Vibrio panuliri]KAB1453730.1 flagellar biosynthesis anti-sigma factor FlgM [Vibrio panuliri]OLQ91912.1 flagellar biosynthesis anti-sigma factor FlgM [Vibrio panuliri]OLQ96445.1 flagellar biosynthesis anti-sigma factor FlgM [Vibrio panuliri]
MAGIDNIRAGQTLATNTRSASRSSDSSTSTSTSAAKTHSAPQDAVSLSSEGKAVGAMHNQMVSQPSFDQAKVAAIKEAIANGSYTVDPEKLADNMIKFEKELGGL